MLDERQRRAVELLVAGRMDKKDIAIELGVTYEALRKWQLRADFREAVSDCESLLDVDVYTACKLMKERDARGGDGLAQTFVLNNPDIFRVESLGDELDGLDDRGLRRELELCQARAGRILEMGR